MSQGRWRGRLDSRLLVAGESQWLANATAGLACAVVVASFWAVAGVPGALAGLAVSGLWYVLGTPYAVAAGAVVLAATTTEHRTTVLAASVGFLALVLAPALETPDPRRYVLGVVAAATVLATGTWVLVQATPLWLAGTTLLLVLALAAYGLYRVSLLRLGLLDPASQPGTPDDASTRARTPETAPESDHNSD